MLSKLLRPIAHAAIVLSVAAVASCAAPSATTQVTSAPEAAKPDPRSQPAWQEHAKGHGKSVQLPLTPDQARAAVNAAIRWNAAGTPVDYRGDDGTTFVISKPATSAASFENVQIGAWIDTMNTDKVELTLVVVGPDTYEMGGPNEQQVLKDVEKAAQMINDGKTLPDKRP